MATLLGWLGSKDEVVSEPLVAAAMCLKNVLLLVDASLREEKPGSGRPSCNVAEAEANLLEDAALLKLAWVQLCQRDHVAALRHSKRILVARHVARDQRH